MADRVAKSQYIVSGAADSSMKMWDIKSGKCVYTWDFLTAVKRVAWRCVQSFKVARRRGFEADE
jgi:WD40 repeat protein